MRVITTLGLMLLILPALAGAEIAIDAPAEVPEGTAFTVTLRADAGTDSLRVDWLGRSLHPPHFVGEGEIVVRVLLGVGMRERLEGESWTLSSGSDSPKRSPELISGGASIFCARFQSGPTLRYT